MAAAAESRQGLLANSDDIVAEGDEEWVDQHRGEEQVRDGALETTTTAAPTALEARGLSANATEGNATVSADQLFRLTAELDFEGPVLSCIDELLSSVFNSELGILLGKRIERKGDM